MITRNSLTEGKQKRTHKKEKNISDNEIENRIFLNDCELLVRLLFEGVRDAYICPCTKKG